MKIERFTRPLLLLPLLLALGACETTAKDEPPIDPRLTGQGPPPELEPPKPIPWTSSFRQEAILIAEEVRIEGPKGLLDHVAARIEEDHHTYEVETLPEGFQQVFTAKDPDAGMEMTAYLDAWRVVALHRLVLLERPGDVLVTVQAVGDAFWRDLASGAEKRGSSLLFRGDPPE